jgi:hypothetical protein
VVDVLDAGKPLGAHRAHGGRFRIALDVGDYSILDSSQHTAAAVAAFTGCFNYFSFTHGRYLSQHKCCILSGDCEKGEA